MKKLSLIMMAMAIVSATSATAAEAPLNSLEILDPDYQGSSFDYQTEIERKVNELDKLQFTTEQSNKIKDIVLNQERVLSTPYTNVPTPVTRSINVKFTPGLTPPVLRLSANMLTTIVFTDAAGNPWDISTVSINKNLFNAGGTTTEAANQPQQAQQTGTQEVNTTVEENYSPHNILTLEPLNPAAYGNIAITLEGLPTPVIFILTTGQGETDMRVDARISSVNKLRAARNGNLPNNGSSTYSTALSNLDDSTLLFADGTPPEEAVRLKSTSSEIEVWLFKDDLIARTTSTIIYPSFKSSVTSTGGVSVYTFDPENQSITISDKNGLPKTIHIENE